MTRCSAPTDIAEYLGIDTPAVLKFIAAGELIAHDVSAPGSRCRRWRIAPDDLAAFLLRRRSRPASPQPKRKKRAVETAGEFY
jgi:hypothetical protein